MKATSITKNALAIALLVGIVLCQVVLVFGATLTVKKDGAGDFTTVQAALDAAVSGDTVIVHPGTYTEDVNIGHFNVPPLKKDNISLEAAESGTVEIIAANKVSRVKGLGLAGFDAGPSDYAGFVVNGDNAFITGIKFVQPIPDLNLLGNNLAVAVGSSGVTFRKCEIAGPSTGEGPAQNYAGEVVAIAITPLDVAGFSQGTAIPPTNLKLENCKIHSGEFGLGIRDLLGTGSPPKVTAVDCEIYYNRVGVEHNDGTMNLIDCDLHDNITGVVIPDDTASLVDCTIRNNLGHGINIHDGEFDNGEAAAGLPLVTIDGCEIAENGDANDQYGIRIETGTITVTHTIIRGNCGANVFFNTHGQGETKITFDHCDFYRSVYGFGILTTDDPDNVVTVAITNSIIDDYDGITNNMDALADFTVDYCDVFAAANPFVGDFITAANTLHVEPDYVDAVNGDFALKPDSPLLTAGKNGTYLGSQGAKTSVQRWMVY